MAVGRDTIRVNDAWIATAANGDPEDQVQPNTNIWVRVNVEAGSSLWGAGTAYRLHVILLDITANYTNKFSQVVSGHLNDAKPGNPKPDPWAAPGHTFTFGPINSGVQDTLLRIEVVLTSGVTGQGVNVFEGDMCVVVD